MMWIDALRTAVNQYPGGRPAVALRLCKSDEVLRKELANTSNTHKLGLSDTQQIVEMLSEQGIDCSGFKSAVDAACVSPATVASACLHMLAADSSKEMADVVSEVAMSLSDQHMSDNDRRRVDREIQQAIEKLTALRAAVNARHAKDNEGRAE